MIKLNLGIGEGDVKIYNFKNIAKLCKFISEFKKYDCIWVFAEDGDGEIIITKSIDNIIKTIKANIFNNMEFFMQEYQTYEDAYAVALNMKEINPKCYN